MKSLSAPSLSAISQPVRRLLPYAHQVVTEQDIAAVTRVLRSEWLTTGPEVEQFEAELAARVGARHAVAFTSATAALHGAVSAAGIGAGDEGITSPMTFCATANCLVFTGATPVFADVEEQTLTIDPAQVARRVTRRTKAILPGDYAGHPARLDELRALARRRKLLVIGDACHALGAEDRGRRIGSLSDITIFSFHPVKHITTGEGGMAVTNSAMLARRLRRFRNHGVVRPSRDAARRPWYYEMVDLGYNYRIPDILCALGRSQLSRLDENLARRRSIAAQYARALSALPGVRVPAVRSGANPAWHLYPIRIDAKRVGIGRDEAIRRLRAEGIGATVHYIPVTRHPYYRKRFGCRPGDFPVAEKAFRQLITLPLSHGMTDADVRDVIDAVERTLAAGSR